MQGQTNIESIWNQVVDDVKMKVIRPTLWRSMEMAAPIIMENGWFVVGFPPGSYHMSGNLSTGDHQNAIENAILQFTGQKLKLRIIEGDTLEDWTHAKFKDMHVERLREQARTRSDKESSTSQAWESLLEQISRRYAVAPLRGLPQGKARYLKEMLDSLIELMDEIMPIGTTSDEFNERALSRALEKIAQLTEVPSTLLALELIRMRGE